MRDKRAFAAVALFAAFGCNGSGSSSSGGAGASTTAPATTSGTAPATSTTSPTTAGTSAPVWHYPGSLPATTSSATTSPSPSTTGTPGATATGVVLTGTVPPDPTTAFTGSLFILGERIAPGSSAVISFQGIPVATQLVAFYSSQTVGVTTIFGLAGTYTITVVSPLGATSNALTLNVSNPPSPTTAPTPDIQMVFPPSFDTTFVGNAWIMGDNFLPGATLVGTGPAGPIAEPLLFVNTTTLGWATATPLTGTYTVSVLNPDLQTSKAVSFAVGQVAVTAGLPAPTLAYAPAQVTSPFFGTLRIFGSDFQLGAVAELTDSAGNKTTTPLLFIASDEVWWELTYPQNGTYTALVRNPDGQATTMWSFQVN